MDRAQLFDALSNLSPQDFERLLFAVKPPSGLIPSPEAPQINRVKALLDWAEGSSGQGIDEVQDCFSRLKEGTLPKLELSMPNFQPYLESILKDEDYLEGQKIYTTTTVEGRKQVNQPKLSSRLKLRGETVKPSKEGAENEGAKEQVEQWDVLAGLRKYAAEHVLLIGKPGSGKSTSLEQLLWEEAEHALQNPQAKIPVWVKLRRCTSTLEHLIQDFFSLHQSPEITDIEHLLQQGKLLLLLDGLNELPETFRTEIANFRDRHRKTTPMIVSTRDLAVGGTLGITKTLKMLPMTEPQMREFVRGYLGKDGDRLFQQLNGDRLQKFAETPLLLWMLCRVFAQNGQVPANLGLAFREFTQLYDQGTEEQKAIQEDAPVDSRKQWPKLLRYLAFETHNCKSVDPRLLIPREEAEDLLTTCLQQEGRINARENAERWLQDLLDYHLLQPVMQPNHVEHIEFHHQLIQEYYAAEYLWRLLPELSDEQLKRDYLNLLKWTEAIALTLALVNEEAQALRVVKLAMDDVDLMLGARLAGEVNPVLQCTTIGWLNTLSIPLLLKCQCWSSSRSDRAIEGLLNALKDPDFSICRSAISALGDINSELSINALLNVLSETAYPDSAEILRVLKRTSSEQTVDGLLDALRNSDNSEYNVSIVETLVDIGGNNVINGLLNALTDTRPDVRWPAASALGFFGDERVVNGLLNALHDTEASVRIAAGTALGRIGDDKAVDSLIIALKDDDDDLSCCAAIALAEIGSERAVAGLMNALDNTDIDIRRNVAVVLKYIGSDRITESLLNLLNDADLYIRWNAVEALGKIDNECAIDSLLKALGDTEAFVRRNAAEALGKIGSERAIDGLINTLDDAEVSARRNAAEALGKIGNERAIDSLLNTLNDTDTSVRAYAAQSLVKIGSEHTVNCLIHALYSTDELEQKQLLKKSLINIGSKRAIEGFLGHLGTVDPKFRTLVEASSGSISISSHTIIDDLISTLEHTSSTFRLLSTIALGKIANGLAVDGLIKALNDKDSEVRKQAAIALARIGSERAMNGLLMALSNIGGNERNFVAAALGEKGSPSLLKSLWQLHRQRPESYLWKAIAAIQNRCQFYNHEIWQAHLTAQRGDSTPSQSGKRVANTVAIQTVENLTIMSDKAPIFKQQHATIGVNYAAEGSQQDFTQHIHAPEQNFEILLTGYIHFIDELQQQNPHVTDETAIIQTIGTEARRIDTRWQNFLNLKRLWNGGKKAAIKVSEHFVESNPWGKGAIAFLEGVSEDMK